MENLYSYEDGSGTRYCKICDEIIGHRSGGITYRIGFHGRQDCWRALRRLVKADEVLMSYLRRAEGESPTIMHAGTVRFMAWWGERGWRLREVLHGRADHDRHLLRPTAGR